MIKTAEVDSRMQLENHFSLKLPTKLPARDEMTDVQFDQMMEIGLKQAKEDDSFDVDEVFAELK